MIGLRLSEPQIASVDRWAKDRGLTRSDAIRDLIAQGLASDVRVHGRAGPKAAARAAEIAGEKLDQLLADQPAPAHERARRKRRLLKGPKEFRD